MTKNEVILQIRRIFVAHLEWKNAIQKIHLGFHVLRKDVDLSQSDCIFGLWYYGEGQYLSNLSSFLKLETLHEKAHHILQSIYKLNLKEVEIDNELYLKSSIDNSKTQKQKLIMAYCKDLNKANKKFSKAIKKLYAEILTIPESHFQKDILLTSK